MDRERQDWLAWHQPYEDKASPLSRRLAVVQNEIRRLLPEKLTQPYTIVSLCAGQGDDLLGVLQDYPDAAQIRARLVELDGRNVATLREKPKAQGSLISRSFEVTQRTRRSMVASCRPTSCWRAGCSATSATQTSGERSLPCPR